MDPYAVLGLQSGASAEEIRRAFRRMAAKWHPDRNPGDKRAASIFKEASAAYELLTNPRKPLAGAPPQASRPAHGSYAAPPPPFVRRGKKKKRSQTWTVPPAPPVAPGTSVPVKPDVKLGSVPLADVPPWMARFRTFGPDQRDDLDRR